ncbi:hypothetical protein ACQYRI_11775 [Salmonella enterica]
MSKHKLEEQRQERKHPAKDAPQEHGEVPRTRDDSQDDKKDPYQDKGK